MKHRIDSIERLEALYAAPAATSVAKETPTINDAYRRLIEAAPFVAVASAGPGGMDCSPRGDGAGFVKILDERTLVFPDRRGNNQLDTLRNIIADPRIALLFLIPGLNETLRVNGRAYLSTDPDLLQGFVVQGKAPVCAVVVEVETLYFQCARALKRSRLWDSSTQVAPDSLPSAGALIKSVMNDFDSVTYDGALQGRQEETLY
ncbi:MAG: pyridoxamine 5'-phosphate oxidase family protein [Gammaproteobacteria bacterium]|nr:pyridoxamine 5'-phosphate oxidase family protein [Gammaproteobacteria bacterium]